MLFEKRLRRLSYSILNVRDNLAGWKTHCRSFSQLLCEPRERIQQILLGRLRQVVRHAQATSAYYSRIASEVGFSAEGMADPADLRKLPYLTKEIIENQKHAMVSSHYRLADLDLSHTGGTSGNPTSFYRDRNCTLSRVGRQWAVLGLCGYHQGDRCGLIWGVHEDLPKPHGTHRLKKWFRQFATGLETLCCTDTTESMMFDYYRRLQQFGPSVLYGYPNAMSEFAMFVIDRKLRPIHVRRVLCTAERLAHEKRQLLNEVFGGEVYNLYCTREHGCIGFECPKHSGFHIDSGSVYLEIVSDNQQVSDGHRGEVVITDLLNYGMPFIRYKIGDTGALSVQECDCGCPLPLLSELNGRVSDIIYTPHGHRVAGVMLLDMFIDLPEIRQVQIVQESIERVDLYLVVGPGFSQQTQQRAVRNLRAVLGREMGITVKKVPEIARNPKSGKIDEVICRITAPANN